MNTNMDKLEVKIPIEKLISVFSCFDEKFKLFGRSVTDFGTGEAMQIRVANHDEVLLNVRDVMTSPLGVFDVSYNYMKKRVFQKRVNHWVRETIKKTLNNLTESEVEYVGRKSCGRKVGVRSSVNVECSIDMSCITLVVTNPQHLINYWYNRGLVSRDLYVDAPVSPGKFLSILLPQLKKLIQYNEFFYAPNEFEDITIDCNLLLEIIDGNGEDKIVI